MQVHVINSGHDTDDGYHQVTVQSLRMDLFDRPYAIVSHPYRAGDSCRAEFVDDEWLVDFD